MHNVTPMPAAGCGAVRRTGRYDRAADRRELVGLRRGHSIDATVSDAHRMPMLTGRVTYPQDL